MISLGIIEDNRVLRSNYEDYFNASSDFELLFSLDDIKGLNKISHSAQPDILLLDLLLPSGNSLEQINRIRQFFPFTKIIILSSVTDVKTSKIAIHNGANGYLLKTSSLSYINDALLKAHDGGTPLSPLIVNHLFEPEAPGNLADVYPSLTRREIELIDVLKTGMSNKMAATALNVTFFTINQHLKNIYTKLHINSKNELISLALKYSPK